jgi:hypothetical protein
MYQAYVGVAPEYRATPSPYPQPMCPEAWPPNLFLCPNVKAISAKAISAILLTYVAVLCSAFLANRRILWFHDVLDG